MGKLKDFPLFGGENSVIRRSFCMETVTGGKKIPLTGVFRFIEVPLLGGLTIIILRNII